MKILNCMFCPIQGETKVLKLKNLRPKDFADYTCQVSVRNVCNIGDKSVTFRLTNATSKFSCLVVLAKTNWDMLMPSRKEAFLFPALTLALSVSESFIPSDVSLHACCIVARESLAVCLFLSRFKLLQSLLVRGNRNLLSLSLSPTSVNLSVPLSRSPITFALGPPLPLACLPHVGWCSPVLFFCCWELISGPSAEIQLSHFLLSPIHSTLLCPAPPHRSATLLLTTTSLPLTTLSDLLWSDWYTTRDKTLCLCFLFLIIQYSLNSFSSLPFPFAAFSKCQRE